MEIEIACGILETTLDNLLSRNPLGDVQAEVNQRPYLREMLLKVTGETAPDVPVSTLTPFSISNGGILKNGKQWKATGCNMRGAIRYNEHNLQGQLDGAKSVGMQIVRFYVAHNELSTQDTIPRVRHILDELQKRNMYGMLVLTDGAYSGFNVRDTYENRNSEGIGKDHYTWKFYDVGFRGAYKKHVEEITAALGNHPAIFAWGIINESFTPSFPISTAQANAMVNFFIEMSDTIRVNSPAKLISTDCIAFWETLNEFAYANNGAYARKIIQHKNINLCTWHSYLINNQPLGAAHLNIKKEMALFANEKSVAWGLQEVATAWEDESEHWFKELVKELFPFASFILVWNTGFVYEVDNGDVDGYWHAGNKDQSQERRFNNVILGFMKAFAEQLKLAY